MDDNFEISIPLLPRVGQVKKTGFSLILLRKGKFSVSVDRLPLIEYFIFFDHPVRSEQIKVKLYRDPSDGRWYDRYHSEEAELHTPEFGIDDINAELKKAIDAYERVAETAKVSR